MIYFLLFIIVIASGLSVFLLKTDNEKNIKLLLSFSGAYLLAISLFNLLPEIYSQGNKMVGLFILLGFFIQILLEYFSKGIEHGHVHSHRAFPVVVSLCIHSFLEGMPLSSMENPNQFAFAIALHNIPVSVVLMTLLLQTNKQTAVVWLVVFALMLPLGAGVNFLLEGKIMVENFNHIVLAIVVGIFLHISTTILFESSENHRFNLYKFISIVLGAALALVSF